MLTRFRAARAVAALALVAAVAGCELSGTGRIVTDAGDCYTVTQPTATVPARPTSETTLPDLIVKPCTTPSATPKPAPSRTAQAPTSSVSATPKPTPKPPAPTSAPPSSTAPAPPPTVGRPYFAAADWLWGAIPSDPKLDPLSAAWGTELGKGQHVADTQEYGVVLRGPAGITAATKRYKVPFTAKWGPDPFHGDTMPIPADVTSLPGGGDSQVSVADPTTGWVYSLFSANKTGEGYSATFGGRVALQGDGRETDGGSSTGSNISRFAAVVRADEIAKGVIPHALFFSTNMAKPKEVRYPAAKTDGSNMSGVGSPIPEGARVQLDPAIDLSKIPGITPGELTVGRALQTYGAYVGDNGGARMAFLFEYLGSGSAAQKPYTDAGMGSGDYYGFPHLPFNKLRVLASSTGR